jgi:hypothetical protein
MFATEVDHIYRRWERPDLALEQDNLQALCKPCHSRKTLAEQKHLPSPGGGTPPTPPSPSPQGAGGDSKSNDVVSPYDPEGGYFRTSCLGEARPSAFHTGKDCGTFQGGESAGQGAGNPPPTHDVAPGSTRAGPLDPVLARIRARLRGAS